MANRRDRIPGVGKDGERNIQGLVKELDERLRKLERKEGRPQVVESDTAAKIGEFLNIEAPADGLTIILPQPKPALRNARVTLNFRNANPVRITCILGLVNREGFVISTAIGTFEAVCDGLDGWSVETGVTSSGSAVDAHYLLGQAHGSLPNGSVGSDTTSINFSYTPGGFATWDLNALTGAIVTTANGVATRFAGIRTNGSLQTARTHLNFLDTNTVTWTPADDSGNDEWEMRATARAGNVRDNGSLETPQVFINYLDGPSINLRVGQDAGNQELEVQASYVGTSSEVNLAPSGNLGTVDITTLECGGSVNVVPSADWEIEGFNRTTGNPEGFWFFLSCNNSAFNGRLRYDAVATTTDRMRITNNCDWNGQDLQAIVYYANTRWRVVAMNSTDEVQTFTTAGLTSDLALNSGTTVLRIDTGNNAWSVDGIAGGYNGRRILLMNASNASSTGTLVTGGLSASVAANQIITPGNVNRGGYSRYSALLEYDGTDSTWRIVADTYQPFFLEREETGAGPFDPLTRPLDEHHVMMANAGTVQVLGMTAGAFRGEFAITSAQAGRHVFQDNTATTTTQRLAIPGDVDCVIGDTEALLWSYIDDSASSDAPRWMLMNRTFPFMNTTVNTIHDKLAHNGDNWEVTKSQRKSHKVCEWHEDFSLVYETSLPGILFMGDGTWFSSVAGSAGGSVSAIAAEAEHPGIVRLTTHTVIDNMIAITKGSSISTALLWVRGDQVRELTVVARCGVGAGANTGFFIGFSENPGATTTFAITGTSNSNIMGFLFDTAGALTDTTVHTITRESDGTAVNNDTNITPSNGWHAYTIRQTTLGTVQFLIDDVVVTTHSTQVPDSELLAFGIAVITRTGSAVALDVDYAGFESQLLNR